MATEDERYRTSSQFREWSFTPAQLADTRSKTNSLARKAITERLASSPAPASASASASANPSGANTPIPAFTSCTATAPADAPNNDLLSAAAAAAAPAAPSALLPEFLTPAEEEQLLRYYTVETLRAAEFCGLPTEIRATAAIFLRRFYLTHSVMTYPPTKMLKTCVFFGAKAENYYPRVKSIADKFPKTTGEEILAGEFLLCQGIRFAFDVRHPFRALEGAIMQLRSFADLDVGIPWGPPPGFFRHWLRVFLLYTETYGESWLSLPRAYSGLQSCRKSKLREPTNGLALFSSSAPSSPTPTSTTHPARSCSPPCPLQTPTWPNACSKPRFPASSPPRPAQTGNMCREMWRGS